MGLKWSICSEQIFFGKNIVITLIYLLALFIVQNLQKFLQQTQIMTMHHFWTQNGPFVPNAFFWKIITIILIYLLAHFNVQNLKKTSSSGSRIMRMFNFWVQNSPFRQMIIFSENLFMSLVSFIHAYLHAKNQRQILIY